jgi:hypothetical protein
MAPGADRTFSYDPPGAIGLTDDQAVIMLRFLERDDVERPRDSAGGLQDLIAPLNDPPVTMPPIVGAACGRGRKFAPSASTAIVAKDRVPGSTMLTGDVSIQAVVSWDAVTQGAYGEAGTIMVRGIFNDAGTGACYGLQISVVDAPSATGRLEMLWNDTAGALHIQTGAEFTLPPGQFTILTATRRWISPTSVVLRYYIGDLLLGEVASSDGSIAGSTTDFSFVGSRFIFGDPTDGFRRLYAGVIDELMVVPRELCQEEIEATWLRVTRYQPLGTQLFIESHDLGFPISDKLDSDVQLDNRMAGHALGFAGAKIEEMRANFLPGRAYGQVLQDWITVTRPPVVAGDSIDTLRQRVLARLRQRRGCSIPGIEDAIGGIVDTLDLTELQYISFSNEISDGFDEILLQRWDVTPAGSWTSVAGQARASLPAGSYSFDGVVKDWHYMQMPVGADAKQSHMIAKIMMNTPQSGLETGVFFGDRVAGNYILFGLRDTAGSFQLFRETFVSQVSTGAVNLLGFVSGNPSQLWLHLFQTETDGVWHIEFSQTDARTGYTQIGGDIAHPTGAQWCGIYARSIAALAGTATVDSDEAIAYIPFWGRPLVAYVMLDSALGHHPDVAASNAVIAAIKHAFTDAAFITTRSFIADDPDSLTDWTPMGAL